MPRILIIDDEEPMRNALAAVLAERGYEVVVALNGREGLARHAEQPADLIITDIVMPEMDGIEIISQIKRLGHDTPIIAISGNPSRELYAQVAKSLGARLTLVKPFEPRVLIAAVEQVLGHSMKPPAQSATE
jgi:DNA-binding response OmpR family regulator